MSTRKKNKTRWSRRLAGLLCTALLCGLLPGVAAPAAAEESWVQPYLDKLVSWGVMRGDQEGSLDPDRFVNRAEFISMVNRAYGYTQTAATPFTDVAHSDWYADDIGMAYRAGYFTGTSPTTASPEFLLTREEAAVILARNLVLKSGNGEALTFTDSRSLSDWSRGLIKTASEAGIIHGYPDGSFQPRNNITRGEVASLLVSAIGTPVQQAGDYNLGDVYGNVTITSSGVTLRNTVITGDLYLTGGVGLGNVTLENVRVLGRIITGGAGESNKGDSSIILRNVEAPELVVDTPGNQFVTLRAEGDTLIDAVSVRTPSFLEDTTGEALGLRRITLDGEPGTTAQLAGNIKEVVNATPAGHMWLTAGTANVITADEKAIGGFVTVDQGAQIKDLRLDVGTSVTGKGDVGKLTVSSGGSNSTMLPDQIVIRPGLEADIAGEKMNTVGATESSELPRLLAGYPRADNIAPTSADVVTAANKKGTIYWAVTPIAEGSVEADDLIAPPTYGSAILKSGSLKVNESGREFSAKLTGLTAAGGYYLSAVLVDQRNQHSPVKVTSFGTPDDSVPNFATGYPVMTKVSKDLAQVTVMATKTCRLYYALMPKGAAPVTADNFRAGALTGNLGAGTVDVLKNSVHLEQVNKGELDEVESYDLYLWLNDVDGAKSSAVKKLTFTTADETNPEFMSPMVTDQKAASVALSASMNEDGTLFWVVVKSGAEYPKPAPGKPDKPALNSPEAKIQVANGAGGVLKSGRITLQKDYKPGTISVTGLTAETAYDFYCIAQDKAGNYAESVLTQRINTQDPNAPTAAIEFSKYNSADKMNPTAETDITVVFSEEILTFPGGVSLVDYYDRVKAAGKGTPEEAAAKAALSAALQDAVLLYDLTDGKEKPATVRQGTESDWTVDYRNAEITLMDGKTSVKLPTAAVDGALNLRSGATYRLDLQAQKLSDRSRNTMPSTSLPDRKGFTIMYAQVTLKETSQEEVELADGTKVPVHLSFEMAPIGTSKVDATINWDLLLWSDTSLTFKLYRRELKDGVPGQWAPVAKNSSPDQENTVVVAAGGETPLGVSMTKRILQDNSFEQLRELNKENDNTTYEYAVAFIAIKDNREVGTWSGTVKMKVGIAAGLGNALSNLSLKVTPSNWESRLKDKSVTSVGYCVAKDTDELPLERELEETVEPKFINGYPLFAPGDSKAVMTVMMDRQSDVYYQVAPAGKISTLGMDGRPVPWGDLPTDGSEELVELSAPGYLEIIGNSYSSIENASWGRITGGAYTTPISLSGLLPETDYYVYFVLKGNSANYSKVFCYGFHTQKVVRPVLELTLNNPAVNMKVDRDSTVDYLLITEQGVPEFLKADLVDSVDSSAVIDPKWEGFTLWDAIQTDVIENDKSTGSVFDKCVRQGVKDDVASYIRNSTPNNNVVLKSPENGVGVLLGKPAVVDCTQAMEVGTQYIFLAVARSPLGSGDAFRAIRPVELTDTAAPVVQSCSASLERIPDSNYYQGSITITFSKPLYHVVKGNPQTITGIEASHGAKLTAKKLRPIAPALLTMPDFVEVAGSPPNVTGTPMYSIRFTVNKIKSGEEFVFDGAIGNISGTTLGQPMNVKVNITEDETGAVVTTFDITPKKCDGRES